MKICYLSNTAIPSKVASAIQIVKMCEAFSELKHKVILITTNDKKTKLSYSNYYNVKNKFIFERVKFFKSFPLGINYYLFSFFSIYQSLKYKPNIYITRNFFTCFLLIILKKKIVFELHQDLKVEARIVRFLVKYLKFLNSRNIIKVIAISHGVKNEFLRKRIIKKNKLTVLASGSSIRSKYTFDIKKKYFKIGYFGSLYESRGLNLVKRLAKIDKENFYYLYGDLKNINHLKLNSFGKNIKICDYVAYKHVPKELAKMDILILPYVSKVTAAGDVGNITNFTSPLKLFDYLCAGKIIICSNLNVLKEAIRNNINAIFIKNYQNIYSWKNEILKLKNQPNKQLIISKNNYKLGKNYSLTNRAKKILKLIDFNR